MTTGERSTRPKLVTVSDDFLNHPEKHIHIGLRRTKPDTESETSIDIMARTIWGEARGEGRHGMEAVAAVIMNRLAISQHKGGSFWWGNDVIGICKAPWQFSCWNPGDPNLLKLQMVGTGDPVFATSIRIARRALSGLLDDPTVDVNSGVGATHYHHRAMQPKWARGHRPISSIGNHVFYYLVS